MNIIKEKTPVRKHFDNVYENEYVFIEFIGDIKADENYLIGEHTNDSFEISLITDGEGYYKLEENIYKIKEKTMLFSKPFVRHSAWATQEKPFRILYFGIKFKENCAKSQWWSDIKAELDKIEQPICYDFNESSKLFSSLLNEYTAQEQYMENIMLSAISQICYITARNFKSHTNSEQIKLQNNVPDKIMSIIDEMVEEPLNLDYISKKLGYSIPYLCKIFKEKTNITIIYYYNLSRFNLAKKYLCKTDMSITQIAEKLNFNSVHHFSNFFKNMSSVSPTRYKENNIL